MNRRAFLRNASLILAEPAIVRVASLMPVSAPLFSGAINWQTFHAQDRAPILAGMICVASGPAIRDWRDYQIGFKIPVVPDFADQAVTPEINRRARKEFATIASDHPAYTEGSATIWRGHTPTWRGDPPASLF